MAEAFVRRFVDSLRAHSPYIPVHVRVRPKTEAKRKPKWERLEVRGEDIDQTDDTVIVGDRVFDDAWEIEVRWEYQ